MNEVKNLKVVTSFGILAGFLCLCLVSYRSAYAGNMRHDPGITYLSPRIVVHTGELHVQNGSGELVVPRESDIEDAVRRDLAVQTARSDSYLQRSFRRLDVSLAGTIVSQLDYRHEVARIPLPWTLLQVEQALAVSLGLTEAERVPYGISVSIIGSRNAFSRAGAGSRQLRLSPGQAHLYGLQTNDIVYGAVAVPGPESGESLFLMRRVAVAVSPDFIGALYFDEAVAAELGVSERQCVRFYVLANPQNGEKFFRVSGPFRERGDLPVYRAGTEQISQAMQMVMRAFLTDGFIKTDHDWIDARTVLQGMWLYGASPDEFSGLHAVLPALKHQGVSIRMLREHMRFAVAETGMCGIGDYVAGLPDIIVGAGQNGPFSYRFPVQRGAKERFRPQAPYGIVFQQIRKTIFFKYSAGTLTECAL